MLALSFFLGGPYWGVMFLAIGIAIVLHGHYPKLFASRPAKFIVFSLLLIVAAITFSMSPRGEAIWHPNVATEKPKGQSLQVASTSSTAQQEQTNTSASTPAVARKPSKRAVKEITSTPPPAPTNTPPTTAPLQQLPMSQECAPGASCAQSAGQSGGITAGTYIGHVDPPPRVLSPEQIKSLREAAALHPSRFLILYENKDMEAYRLGVQIQDALVAEGWVPQQQVTEGLFSSEGGGPLSGINIAWQGKTVSPGSQIHFDQSTSGGALSLQLQHDFPEAFHAQTGDMGPGYGDRVLIQIFANPRPIATH